MSEALHAISGKFPLSVSQRNIWNLEQLHKGTSINNICSTLHIRGRLDIAAIQKTLNLVLASDPSLRTCIVLENGEPMQYHAAYTEEQFPVFDFSLTNPEGISHWETAVAHEAMPLYEHPLYSFAIFKSGESHGGVLLKTHHIISDGWSQVLLGNRLSDTYLALLAGKEPELPVLDSYEDHVKREQEYLQSRMHERDRSYWAEKMESFQEPCALKECKSAVVSPVGQRQTYALSQVLNHAIRNFCEKNRVAPFAVLYMALAIYLRRISGVSQLGIGVPIFNRVNFREKQTTGMFVSTLPFLNTLDENWSLEEFTQQLNTEWMDLLRHQKYPFSDIVALAKEKHPDTDQLFHVVLSYQNSRLFQSKEASALFTGRWHYSGYQAEPLVIHLSSLEYEHRYSIDYDYLTQIFSAGEIERLHHYLTKILKEALAHPQRPIWQLSVLSDGEEEKVLFTFNQTAAPLSFSTIGEKFLQNVKEYPQRVALICNGRRISYEDLQQEALRYAGAIHNRCPEKGQLIAVSGPKDFSLVAAMLGVSLSGNAWVLLPLSLPEERRREILEDSGASLLIGEGFASCPIPVLEKRELSPLSPEDLQACGSEGKDLAYVVYTSGSTGRPKGVEIRQESLLNFAFGMEPLYGHGGVLSLCSIGFDVFVLESMVSLLNGKTVILAGEAEAENPSALASLIRSYAVGVLALTPSRLQAYMKNPEFLQALKRVESIICGGEHLSGDLIQRLRFCSGAAIYNQYGPSEATIGVSYERMNDAPAITIGSPMPNCRMYVLDGHCQPLPIGVYGDLYIGGLCVGQGYRNAPELTAESFSSSPFEPGERLYRTGDVACWTQNGKLLLGGRKDNQIKLRGLRIEPQEIAVRLMEHPLVESAAVCVAGNEGHPFLAAYYTSAQPVSQVELLSFLVTCLPDYMLPAYLRRVEEMPFTPNGKIDYKRLPVPELCAGRQEADTSAQKVLLEIFRSVLKNPEVGVESDYFLCGGDSLNAMETIHRIENAFGISLKVVDLYAFRTVLRLEKLLQHNGLKQEPRAKASDFYISKAPALQAYPLTPTQQSLYFQSKMDPSGLAYNMPGVFRFQKEPDMERLEEAFRRLIQEEEIFRTSFVMEAGGVFQKIQDTVPFSMDKIQAKDLDSAQKVFLKPFVLEQAPLLRVAIWENSEREKFLFLDMHHLVSDGISTPLLLKRLDAYYQGKQPILPAFSFKDYAYDLERSHRSASDEQQEYWKKRLENMGGLLDLPVDKQRPKQFDYKGDVVNFSLDGETAAFCQEYCAQNDLSPYMLFAAVFAVLLSKYTGCEEVILGTPVSGRHQPELWKVMGPFLNTLPLRLFPGKEKTGKEFLQEVRSGVLEMLDHQEISLEEILSLAGVERVMGQTALYNVMFSYRPMEEDVFQLDGKPISCTPLSTGTAKMDLNLEAYKTGEGFAFRLEYASSLYYRDSMELLSRCFCALVQEMLRHEDAALYDLQPVSKRDRLEILELPNRRKAPYVNLCIDQMVDQMADLLPDAPAIRAHGKTMTYRQLKERSDALAGQLQAAGARKGDFIALAGKRDTELVAGMLGILKAGCAYVPVLASFPEARLSAMLEISGARFLFCDGATFPALPEELPCPKLIMGPESVPFVSVKGRSVQDDIHVLFTSGTTGEPKGTILPHRAIANLLVNVEQMFQGAQGDILCASGVIFDTFITETLLAFCMGKCSVMADEEEMMLPWKLAELIRQENVEILQLTPSRLQMCLVTEEFVAVLPQIKVLFSCGEVLTRQLLDRLKAAGAEKIFNLYGPTETAVYITGIDMTHRDKIVVGKAFTNCRLYVLDENLRPVMPMARGELYIGGECLSRGYVNRPDLTRASYLPDPFFPHETMYKSGDIVRMMPDRGIEFVGRKDLQVKLNGQRIELDEITGQILRSGKTAEAAVVAVCKPDFSMELRAFVTESADGSPADIQGIKAYLKKQLPGYMVPSTILQIPQIPKTATGKVDRRSLEKLDPVRIFQESQARERTQEIQEKSEKADASFGRESAGEECRKPAALEEMPSSCANGEKEEQILRKPFPVPPVENRVLLEAWKEPAAPNKEMSESQEQSLLSPGRDYAEEQHLPENHEETFGEEMIAAEPESEIPETEEKAVETAGSIEERVLAVWKAALNRDEVDEKVSFFDQGGTSLAALTVLSQYFKQGWSLTLSQFYDAPLLSAQIQLIRSLSGEENLPEETQKKPENTAACPWDQRQFIFSQWHTPEEDRQRAENRNLSRPKERTGTLLTGATGFLGAHLVRALIEAGETRIFCLLRDGSRNRLLQILSGYFGEDWVRQNQNYLEVVAGNIVEDRLGLSSEKEFWLAHQVGQVIHAAADVRHYAKAEESLRTNVTGTQNVISFAEMADAQLLHISTISVSGEYLLRSPQEYTVFTEQDLEIGQNWQENLYVRGKFLGEEKVRQAMQNGLQAKIFRIGRLVGRSSDGKFQKNPETNAFYRAVRGFLCLDALPVNVIGEAIELTAVDECAQALVKLRNGRQETYHLMNPQTLSLREMLQDIGAPLPVAGGAEFERRLQKRLELFSTELAPVVEIWNRVQGYGQKIYVSAEKTVEELALCGFHWKKPDAAVLLKEFKD